MVKTQITPDYNFFFKKHIEKLKIDSSIDKVEKEIPIYGSTFTFDDYVIGFFFYNLEVHGRNWVGTVLMIIPRHDGVNHSS